MKPTSMTPLVTCFWFDGDARRAAEFYASVFPGASVGDAIAGDDADGEPLTVDFEIGGTRFVGLNGGDQFTFNEATSFQVLCETQEEIDYYWEALTTGGEPGRCGWLKDPFGVSWQVVPRRLIELFADEDPDVRRRVTEAFMPMSKLDLAAIEAAATAR
ncbi:VOC family protein [Zhihengliuella halotolerans]|uniref:VOC family protein n=1 Tax=Zhihengliuella halotolerans TaxID=370736 RepID=UPI002155388F|nr:VOC family protein [Zhihengliuella halotolerans]